MEFFMLAEETISCTADGLSEILAIVAKVMKVIYIIVPVLIVLWGTFDLLKAVIAQKDEDMKKAWQTLLKRVIYGVLIFLLGTLVSWVMTSIGTTTAEEACGIREIKE